METQLSSINLTDKLYSLFKTDNCASELRQFDCPSDDDIWHYLGFYKEGVVTLCEKNIQSESKNLSESRSLNMTQTQIYWAIEELVRLHEHAHHLFFDLRWRTYISNGKPTFIFKSSVLLAKLRRQEGTNVYLKSHTEYEKTSILRSILDLKVRSCFEKAVIESLPQFAVYFMIRGNAELEGVFKALDDISPPEYKHWKDIFNNCKAYQEDDEITVIPFVFNVVTSVLSSNGLINNLSDPAIITIEEVLESLRCLSEGS